jgi:hypothetical protein
MSHLPYLCVCMVVPNIYTNIYNELTSETISLVCIICHFGCEEGAANTSGKLGLISEVNYL